MYLSSYTLIVIPLFGLLASAAPNPQVVERGPSPDLVVDTTVNLASHRYMQRNAASGGGGGGVVDWKRAIGNSQPAPPMKR